MKVRPIDYRLDYRSKKHPALIFVLRGLLPYTMENVLLSFKPGLFFAELEKVSGYKRSTLSATYYRAKQQGLIEQDIVPTLTEKGLQKVRPYTAKKLGDHARLIVFFDIPQDRAYVRENLRRLLKNLGFEMIQRSVWVSDMDYRSVLLQAIEKFQLQDCVEVHESLRLFPK
ncbi:CRISPR-associated endonuclease Cas2 [Candidatus Saccharibacteria bacterium]|nr:MAG: CRISPR-associated endonuclease Cas2 [Candidatus Saccharibacteria bacterium]